MVEFAFGMPVMSLFGGRLFIVTDLLFVLVFFLHLDFLNAIGSSSLVDHAIKVFATCCNRYGQGHVLSGSCNI
jgi:hypothetical protein